MRRISANIREAMITDTTKSIARFPRMLTISSIVPDYFLLPDHSFPFHAKNPQGEPYRFLFRGENQGSEPQG
jgi:hypothetical protein